MHDPSCHTLISVDPGQQPGYVVARRQHIDDPWVIAEIGQSRGNRAFTTLARAWTSGQRLLYVEDQFIGQPRTIIGLIRDAQDWMCCGRLLGYDCYRLFPNTWISRIKKGSPRLRRDARKALAMDVCDSMGLPVDRLSQDMADAVCILVAAVNGGEVECSPNLSISQHS